MDTLNKRIGVAYERHLLGRVKALRPKKKSTLTTALARIFKYAIVYIYFSVALFTTDTFLSDR